MHPGLECGKAAVKGLGTLRTDQTDVAAARVTLVVDNCPI